MSNNSLPCSKCRGQHHPADECSDPDRTEAAKLLMCLSCYDMHYYSPKKFDADVDLIMDHILADRARVVDPLVEFKECFSNMKGEAEAAINESLRRAGRKE